MKSTLLVKLFTGLLLVIIGNIAMGDDKIYFNFDYSIFRGENGNSILEIYYSVSQKSLKYLKNEEKFEAAAKIEIEIFDINNNKNVYTNVYKTPSIVSDTSNEVFNQKLVGQINYLLPDGNYKLKIIGSDFNDSTSEDFYEQEITVENSIEQLKISDIELSTYIQKAKDEKSIFYKNTLEIIPNPSNLFGMNLKEVYYYFEIYGLSSNNISDEYELVYSVVDLNNNEIITFSKKVKRNGEARADYGKLKIDSLKKGSYLFKVAIIDSLKKVNINKEKKFFVFNNLENFKTTNTQDDFLKSEYVTMSEKDVESEFEKTEYIRTDIESQKFESLNTTEDKRKFLHVFWKSKNNDPNISAIDFKINFLKRINEANKLFKEPYKDGWRTDRGRIFIIYGKPDDVEKFPFESSTKSYEVWKYNSIEGGGECVFIERQPTTSVYWLVHSTFRNELRNDNWRSELN